MRKGEENGERNREGKVIGEERRGNRNRNRNGNGEDKGNRNREDARRGGRK